MITFSYLALLLFYCNYSFLYNFILIHPEVPIGCPKKRLWIFWSKYTFLYKSHWSGSIFLLFEGSQPQNVLISEAAIKMCSWERCSENIQQIERRTPMLNAKQLFWNHTSAWVFSCQFAAYFQNTFFSKRPLDGYICYFFLTWDKTFWCF